MMRRSFGSGGGSGGTGSGAVLRTLQRTIRTTTGGAQEPFSSHSTTSPQPTNTSPRSSSSSSATYFNNNKPNNTLCLSSPSNSSSFSRNNNPFGGIIANNSNWVSSDDEFQQWEHVDHDHERVSSVPIGFNCVDRHLVFGHVPSVDEVQQAISSINQVFDPVAYSQPIKDKASYDPDKDVPDHITRPTGLMGRIHTAGSEVAWMEPSLNIYNSRLVQRCGSNKVYDAFQLLQTEPSVQRMVISLSSDTAVWDAVLNNEAVQEFRKSLDDVDTSVDVSSKPDEGSDYSNAAMVVLGWIFITTKGKIIDLIDKITKMVDELFLPPKSNKIEKGVDPFEDKLRTSLMLSVVIFLVVVVTRASRA